MGNKIIGEIMKDLETKTTWYFIECSDCGYSYEKKFLHDTGDGCVCGSCFGNYKECENCGDVWLEDDMYYINDESVLVCKHCFDNYAECDECSELVHNDKISSVGDEYWCDSCYENHSFTCGECNDRFNNNEGREVEDYVLCEYCFENGVLYCVGCEEPFLRRHLNYSGYCVRCEEYNEDEEDNHDNPPYRYYRLDSEAHHPLYYGIELETGTFDQELYNNWHEEILDKIPDCFFTKSDSSIYDNSDVLRGTEIVSHPMTYKWLKANQGKWNKVLNLRKKGLRSYVTDSCGIHIHLTKSWFSEKHLYKFMKMIYCFPSFTTMISQRRKSQLKSWGSLEDVENLKKKAKDKYWYKRYTAVNLCNSSTVEIRIFRGTLDKVAFWKDIEYIQALVEFTEQAKVKDLKIKNFVWYISYKQKEFPNLYKWLKKKGKIKN